MIDYFLCPMTVSLSDKMRRCSLKSRWTAHAHQQLGRTQLSEAELEAILDQGLCVPIGIEEKSQKVHKLFYSAKDKQCFVAIQDDATGEIVTILTLDYHNRWIISLEVVAEAKRLIRALREAKPRTIRFVLIAELWEVNRIKIVVIDKISCFEHNREIKESLNSDRMLELAKAALLKIGIKFDDCSSISIRTEVGKGEKKRILSQRKIK